MQKQDFLHLWGQYRAGTLTATDRGLLAKLIRSGNVDVFLHDWMAAQDGHDIELVEKTSQDWEMLWEKIQSDILVQENTPSRITVLFKKYYKAAAAVVLLGLFSYLLMGNWRRSGKSAGKAVITAQIEPGKTGAFLTLSDGTVIPLTDSVDGVVAHQNGTAISYNNGSVSFPEEATNGAASYNTLTTPMARKINIILGDGTRVWLNAGSSLHFPSVFNTAERRVKLTGEGYFEVAKKATQPFIVATDGGTEIKVLGTHFNVNAYKNEGVIKTTLLEGAVLVKNAAVEKKMAPGQQVELNESTTSITLLSNVDVSAITAWKDGFFEFNGASIKSIMSQLARWYNVDVIYQDKIDGEFVARIPSSVPLQEVLSLLEATKQVHFIINNQKIIVTK